MFEKPIAHQADITSTYPCRRCGKAYTKLSEMTLHVLSHTHTTQPFACPKPGCDRKFSQNRHLTRHLKSTHLDQKMTACNIFQESMISSTLGTHMQKAHGSMQPCLQCSHKHCINPNCRLGSHCQNSTHPLPSMQKPEESFKGSASLVAHSPATMFMPTVSHVRNMPYCIPSPPQTFSSRFSPPPSPSPSVTSWATPPSPSTVSFSLRSSSPSSAFDHSFLPAWSSAMSDILCDPPCLSSSELPNWRGFQTVDHPLISMTSPPLCASSSFFSFAKYPPASPMLLAYSLSSSASGTSCSSAALPSPALSDCSSLYNRPLPLSSPASASGQLFSSIEKMLVEALEARLVLDANPAPYSTARCDSTAHPAYIGFCTPALPADVHWVQAHVAVAMDLGAVARLDLEALLGGFSVDQGSDGAKAHGYWDALWNKQMDVDENETAPESWH